VLGAQGDAEVFSFHATKPFAIGEGGLVSTCDRALAERLEAMSNFGFGPDRRIGEVFSLNAKMSEMHAAIGLAVLDRFDEVLAARRERAELMRRELEQLGYRFQRGAGDSAWQFVPVLAPSAEIRRAVLVRAAHEEIEIRRYHTPLHEHRPLGVYQCHGDLAVTAQLAANALSLPLANDLPDVAIRRVVALLGSCVTSRPAKAQAGKA
jgi:dTDP-4-amino-4,6-dideoxygalactose transaminase